MGLMGWLRKQSILTPVWVLLNPLWGLMLACASSGKKLSYVGVVLMYALFGYAHTFSDPRADAYRKMAFYKNFSETSSFTSVWEQYWEGGLPDFYEELLCVWLRPVTSDAHIFLAVVGAIAALLLCLSLAYFIRRLGAQAGFLASILFMTMLILFNPVMIGGVRHITASALFLYGAVAFLLENKWYGFALACISPMIHFSLLILLPLLLAIKLVSPYVSIKLLLYILLVVCIISFFMDVANWRGLISRFDWLASSEVLAHKASAYTSNKAEATFNKSLTTELMRVQQYIVRAYILIFVWHILRRLKTLSISQYNVSMLKVTVIFLILGCLMMSFSVVGERYLIFGQSFMIFAVTKLAIDQRDSFFRVLALVTPLVYVFLLGWIVYNSMQSISPLFFISPTLLFL